MTANNFTELGCVDRLLMNEGEQGSLITSDVADATSEVDET